MRKTRFLQPTSTALAGSLSLPDILLESIKPDLYLSDTRFPVRFYVMKFEPGREPVVK